MMVLRGRFVHKGNNKITEPRTILQRESQNSQVYKQTNQSTTGKLWKPQWPWPGTGISKECELTETAVRGWTCRSTRTHYPDSEPTSLCSFSIILRAWQRSNKYQFYRSLVWPDRGSNPRSTALYANHYTTDAVLCSSEKYSHLHVDTFLDTILTNILYLVLHWVVKTNSMFPF